MKKTPTKPRLSVIVPVRNEAKLLAQCLTSLQHQDAIVPYEVLVIDTNSKDGTRDIAKRAGVRLIDQPKRGKVYAFIKGAEEARGDIFCFTEADCIVPPTWIETVASYFDRHKDVSAISGIYTYHDSTPFYNFLARLSLPTGNALYRLLYCDASLRCSNSAIRASAYKKIGGFSDRFLELYDVELGLRARSVGRVHHVPAMENRTSDRRIRGRLMPYIRELIPALISVLRNKPFTQQSYEDIR